MIDILLNNVELFNITRRFESHRCETMMREFEMRLRIFCEF
jgi:hypothetical protein